MRTIAFAISHISSDSLDPKTIYLAPGTYGPSSNEEQFPLYWSSYVNLEGTGQDLTILDAESLSRIFNFYDINDVTLRDLSITNGETSGYSIDEPGGGLICFDSEITFEDLRVNNNIARNGGGIYCINSNLTILNSVIDNNSSHYNISDGGGLCCINSTLNIQNSSFLNNSGRYGGGLACRNSIVDLYQVIIENNTTTGNYNSSGGGIYSNENSSLILNTVVVRGNSTTGSGGGIYLSSDSEIWLENVDIYSNSAAEGGGIRSSTGNVNFSPENRCNIYANTSDGYGMDLVFSENVDVIVDTFSVLFPTDYYAMPRIFFSFDSKRILSAG